MGCIMLAVACFMYRWKQHLGGRIGKSGDNEHVLSVRGSLLASNHTPDTCTPYLALCWRHGTPMAGILLARLRSPLCRRSLPSDFGNASSFDNFTRRLNETPRAMKGRGGVRMSKRGWVCVGQKACTCMRYPLRSSETPHKPMTNECSTPSHTEAAAAPDYVMKQMRARGIDGGTD